MEMRLLNGRALAYLKVTGRFCRSQWLWQTCFLSHIPCEISKLASLQEREMINQSQFWAEGGDGGKGCTSFCRSQRDCRGTPDSGNGGRGGDVISECSPSVWDLSSLQHHIHIKKGKHGAPKNMVGNSSYDKIVLEGQIPCAVEKCSPEDLYTWEILGSLDVSSVESYDQSFGNSSSFGSPSICVFYSNSLNKQLFIFDSLTGIFPKGHFDSISHLKQASCCNFSNGLPPSFRSDSNPLHKTHPLSNSLSAFPSKCSSLPGLSSSFYLFNTVSQSLKKLPVLKCNSSSFCLVSSTSGMTIHCYRRFSRSFSASSTSWTLDSLGGNTMSDIFGLERSCKGTDGGKLKFTSSVNSKIVEIIKSGNDDMESKLRLTCSELKMESITEIFQVLNYHKISGVRFFRWLRCNIPMRHFSSKVCSQIVCNCGCLGDFETMRLLLQEFRSKNICLDENAFTFLSLFIANKYLMKESVRRIVSILNEVGGSCRNSGISALIEMFCNLDLFEMAMSVIEITGKKEAYFNILIRQRCRRGHIEEAWSIIREMRYPTVKNYNYLLGSLCKNGLMDEAYGMVKEMERKGIHGDEITFEILIYYSCSAGNMDHAKQLLNKMVKSSLQPRMSTHSAILKGFFKGELYEEAHNYVIDSSVNCQQSSPTIYSLLAELHQGKGNLMKARDIIVQMMDKGLRPNFRVYFKILGQLQKTGREHMAQDLTNRYNSF